MGLDISCGMASTTTRTAEPAAARQYAGNTASLPHEWRRADRYTRNWNGLDSLHLRLRCHRRDNEPATVRTQHLYVAVSRTAFKDTETAMTNEIT